MKPRWHMVQIVAPLARPLLEWAALDRAALGPLVLGSHGRRTASFPLLAPDQALADLLQPYRRQLWRRRASVVLFRIGGIAVGYLALVGIARAWLAPAWPWQLSWLPALALALWGCRLAVAQRPDLLETAQLLDRRFDLHASLGTALECGTLGREPDGLAALHLMRTREMARRLPPDGWGSTPADLAQRRLLLALTAGALAAWLVGPRLAGAPRIADRVRAGGRPASTIAQTTFLQQPHPARSRQPGAPGSPAQIPPQSAASRPLSVSLQVHAGPALAPAQVDTLARQQATALHVRLGAGPGGTQGSASPSLGAGTTLGAGAGQPPGQAAGPLPGSALPSRPTQPNSASASGGSNQPAQDQQSQSGGTSSGPSTGQNEGGQPSPQGSASGAARGQQPGQSGANPFGQDPRSSTGARPASGRSAGSSAHPTQSRGLKAGTGSRPSSDSRGAHSTSANPNDDAAAMPRRSRATHAGSGPRAPSQPRLARAGPVRGTLITLGNAMAQQSQAADPQLVRVAPLGASSTSDLRGAGELGPQTVQGYVPEDATSLSPADQALILAYFSQGAPG